jgi:hypothetical protein
MEPSKFRLDIEIEDGTWDIVLHEGDEPKVTRAQLTTDEVLAKIGNLLVDWTKQKK